MLWLPRDLHDRAKGWQGNIPHKAAVERINLHFMMGIVHVGHHKLVVDHDYKIHYIILLGNKLLPVRPLWMLEINGNDTAAWSIQVGLDIEDGAIVDNQVIGGVGLVQQANERAITSYLAVVESILRLVSMPDVQHQVGPPARENRAET